MSRPDLDDVPDFIVNFQRNRTPRLMFLQPDVLNSHHEPNGLLGLESLAPAPSHPHQVHHGFQYETSLMLSESSSASRAAVKAKARSLASSATKCTLIFDSGGASVISSHSSDPSRRGPQPLHRERPPIPLNMVPHELPCDFESFSDCQDSFRHDQVDDLVEHVATQHLNNNLPRHSKCQFCDAVEFVARPDTPENRRDCFRSRTIHHAMHFQEGLTKHQMRPDFAFVDHLRDNNLINEASFLAAIQASELSRALRRQVEPKPGPVKRVRCEVMVASRWDKHNGRNPPRPKPSTNTGL
ncbi:hypothetical protein S7711_02549 [Stachybotrys chartarum IBT 7711]|uniref:Uncharacterized protein n=1 Tax=Stachybotrys chartarum (strain CBS 109288 / IBT 7711) TaxID=1280523 RepID=A0A084B5D5_STACB|nr:hypothetical protein S7711_02549 [Stachybotrys chartarum IBT 7711]KFA50531.1 hypothetical protein S40293_03055 [Stachybotrys chartarum IBT 40293]KFA75553.1 hypothetical protein S40288_08739 [Stachybotrys chartarum IBT 40288]